MKKLAVTIAMLLTGILSFGQVAGTINGKIKDGQQPNILASASIHLLNASDSSVVKIGLANKDGNYSLENIPQGKYIILAHIVGYQKIYSSLIEMPNHSKTITVPLLQLIPLAQNMEAVVVTAKKNFIEQKIDKTVLNMDASITNTGNTILEVLEKAPGVLVDKDGNISLKGKPGVLLMIDGKPTHMSKADLANYLNSVPASSLDKIELMTNPSAKYDAAGNSGIINIITKKNKRKGFNGALALAYGRSTLGKTNNSLNLNYRKGKVNIFSSLSAGYRKQTQQLDINRLYYGNQHEVKAVFDQIAINDRTRQYYNGKIGIDYEVNNKTTIGLLFSGSTAPRQNFGQSESFLKNNELQIDSIVTADRREDNTWKEASFNVNFRRKLDTLGAEITADLDYIKYDGFSNQRILNAVYEPNYSLKYNDILLGSLPTIIHIYSAKVDYTKPFKNDLKLEAGLKTSFVNTENEANYFNLINNVKVVDGHKTSNFNYNENINAAYLNFNKTIKKWGFQLGLRAENTHYTGKQFGNPLQADSTFSNSYTNVFPTAYISFEPNKHHTLALSTGRRIQRPDYEDLNPFLSFIDKYTYEEGNPFLKPMYANTFELTHSYNHFLNSSIKYQVTKDLVHEVFRQSNTLNDSISTINGIGNYGRAHDLSLSINAQVKIAKWFTSMWYAEGNYQDLSAMLSNEKLFFKTYSFTANINNQFTFKKGWSAELSGVYRTAVNEGQIHINAITQVDVAVKKDFLKKKANLKLSVRDLFGPMRVGGHIKFNNTLANFYQQRDSRVVTLGFNYRFGKPIKGLKNRKAGSAADVQNRVGSGN